jgi:hypothetical protein
LYQDHASMGAAGTPAGGLSRSAHCLGLSLWRHLSQRGKGAALVLPRCDTAAITLHLAEIAAAVAPGANAVLLFDQAGWHLSDKLLAPTNLTLLPLPPKCPELKISCRFQKSYSVAALIFQYLP